MCEYVYACSQDVGHASKWAAVQVTLVTSMIAMTVATATMITRRKIWISQQEESEIGGIYLFANRETAEAYLSSPTVHIARTNSAVISTESQLWNVESSLSAITRAPLQDISAQFSEVLGWTSTLLRLPQKK